MLAMATSLRTNSTIASTAAPNPEGAFPSRWRRATWRPPYQIVRNTSAAAMPMKTTCLVGIAVAPKVNHTAGIQVQLPPTKHLLLIRKAAARSEEHTSELQSRLHIVCRLLLVKKKN